MKMRRMFPLIEKNKGLLSVMDGPAPRCLALETELGEEVRAFLVNHLEN